MPEEVLKKLEEKTKLTKEEEELLEAARKKTNVENKVSLQSRKADLYQGNLKGEVSVRLTSST